MLQAAGTKYSPNWHDVALLNLARVNGLDLGARGYRGFALYVVTDARSETSVPAYSGTFFLEYRGPDYPPICIMKSWVTKRRHSTVSRQHALTQMLDLFLRLTRPLQD